MTAPYTPLRLPDFDIAPGVSAGRVPLDGYRRGMAVEFGLIADQLAHDPLWNAALEATGGRSIVQVGRLLNLFLILTHYWRPHQGAHVVEFGSYRGGCALFLATVLKSVDPSARVHALDTFAGMPTCDGEIDAHHGGDFSDADLAGLLARRELLGLDNLFIHQGLFEKTYPRVAAMAPGFGLAHIDADIYSACRYASDAVWPHMRAGGYVVFDDATVASCLGATQVVEELIRERGLHSEQVSPHVVFRAGLDTSSSSRRHAG